jgi:hypothetical protein
MPVGSRRAEKLDLEIFQSAKKLPTAKIGDWTVDNSFMKV